MKKFVILSLLALSCGASAVQAGKVKKEDPMGEIVEEGLKSMQTGFYTAIGTVGLSALCGLAPNCSVVCAVVPAGLIATPVFAGVVGAGVAAGKFYYYLKKEAAQ